MFASGFYQLADIGPSGAPWGPTLLATVVAFFVGLVVIAWLMRFISTRSYMPFVSYRMVLGVVLLALVSVGLLDPDAGLPGS